MRPASGIHDSVRPLGPQPAKIHPGIALAVCLGALAVQTLLPVHIPFAGLIDLPLLAVVYLALLSKNVIVGMLIGMAVGLGQDSLSNGPIGLFGILKTIVGYSAASVSLLIEVDYPGARGVLAAAFFLAHAVLFWMLQSALLGNSATFDPALTLILAATHAGAAILLFRILDPLRPRP